MGKGSNYERQICKTLSLWWSSGVDIDPTDDIFWRSSQSGGRATQRAKSGKATFGSYGDLAFTNPVGAPLLEYFTIELKRGYSDCSAGDLLDAAPTAKQRMFESFLRQAISSHKQAGSRHWLLIHKRDRREAIAYFPARVLKQLPKETATLLFPSARFDYLVNSEKGKGVPLRCRFVGVPLFTLLPILKPSHILKALKL